MTADFIPQMEPWFGPEEARAVCEYMREGGWITEFKRTEQFEQMVAAFVGAKHCIVVNNGTISLTLAGLACGLKAGDEVIVPNYTMIATPNSIKMFGAVPVFVDVEPETLCLDLNRVRAAVTDRTRAVMLVTANGRYPKQGVDAFLSFCRQRELVLIEDAAQSLGSFYPSGKHMGTVGRVGSFSFSAPKIISTGQGGAVITDDDAVAARVRKLKDFGRTRGGIDIHDTIGYNFKFTDLQACVGIEQMKKLSARVERKKEILRLFREHLERTPQVKFFEQDVKHTTPWFYDVLVEDRDGLREYLNGEGIGTRVMYPPICDQEAYRVQADCPVSRVVGKNGLWLPSSTQLTNEQVARVSETIRSYYGKP